MVTADYYYPNWECLVDFFAIRGWKIAGTAWGLNFEPTTLDLSSQSGAYDLSAIATRMIKMVMSICSLYLMN